SQSIALAVVSEAIAIKPGKSLPRAEPEVAFAVLVNGSDVAVGKPVRDVIMAYRKLLGANRKSGQEKHGWQPLRRNRRSANHGANDSAKRGLNSGSNGSRLMRMIRVHIALLRRQRPGRSEDSATSCRASQLKSCRLSGPGLAD